MSYALRKDGLGWRAVDSSADCATDETWQEEQPEVIEAAEHEQAARGTIETDPVGKLVAFLRSNPDVMDLLK